MRRLKIFIFIHKSLGELDWIAPFIRSVEAKDFDIAIYLNKVGKNKDEKEMIFESYGLNKDNVTLLDGFYGFKKTYKVIDKIMQRASIYFLPEKKVWSSWYRVFCGRRLKLNQEFDYVFRDYQLRPSFELSCIYEVNLQAKTIVFPHAVSIQKLDVRSNIVDSTPIVKAEAWLENSILSTRQMVRYGRIFCVSGAPGLSAGYIKPSLFDSSSENILITTRNHFERHGYTRTRALVRFDEILAFCEKNKLKAYIKHHPRDKKVFYYREIQKKYSCVTELDQSLSVIEKQFRACLSFYSTAGLFMTARQIPVFDMSPYMCCAQLDMKSLGFHFEDSQGMLTHDLVEIGVQERIKDFDVLLSKRALIDVSSSQFVAVKKSFPEGANSTIAKKLKKLACQI